MATDAPPGYDDDAPPAYDSNITSEDPNLWVNSEGNDQANIVPSAPESQEVQLVPAANSQPQQVQQAQQAQQVVVVQQNQQQPIMYVDQNGNPIQVQQVQVMQQPQQPSGPYVSPQVFGKGAAPVTVGGVPMSSTSGQPGNQWFLFVVFVSIVCSLFVQYTFSGPTHKLATKHHHLMRSWRLKNQTHGKKVWDVAVDA